MKKRTHLDRTGSVCVGFPLDGDSGDGLSSNRGSCSSGGGGTAAALTVYKIIKTNNKLPRDQTLFITPVWTENIIVTLLSCWKKKDKGVITVLQNWIPFFCPKPNPTVI